MIQTDRLKLALEIIEKAGTELNENFTKDREIAYKSDQFDLVTQFDLSIQKMLTDEILKLFPEDKILAEEGQASENTFQENQWIIDPIDGTVNFIHRFPIFCISLAFYGEEEKFGLIYEPRNNTLFHAVEGKGAFLNGKRIHVSNTVNLNESLVTLGTSVLGASELLKHLHRKVRRVRLLGSAAIQGAYVGWGVSEAFIGYKMKIWDIAAAYLLVKEAGGRVTNWDGEDVEVYQTDEMLFTNGKILGPLTKILASIKLD